MLDKHHSKKKKKKVPELEGLQVRWQLEEVDPFVELHVLLVVDVQFFVRIDGHQQRADVRLHQSGPTIHL